VSSDEELANMIKFQHAYNASSRYINTVSEMIEYLIEKLG
jgi:flagellar hook-associated protein 1 FlgK